MIELGADKKYMILGGIGVVVFAFFVLGRKNDSSSETVVLSTPSGVGTSPLFIPTSSYNIEYDYSEGKTETTTKTSSIDNSSVAQNSNNAGATTVTAPVTATKPIVTAPTPTPTPKPAAVTPKPAPAIITPKPVTNTPAPVTKKVTIKYHTVKKGETLWTIAKQYYGNGQKYKQIASDNKIANPNVIYAGTRLAIKL